MILQIGHTQQNIPSFVKQATRSTNEDFHKVLTQNLETSAVDESIYDNIANQYDIRNATFEEIEEIGQQLYGAGVITGLDLALLTFDYDRATQYIKQATNGLASPNFTMYETEADSFGRRDWIAEFEARAAKDRQYGHLIGHANKNKLIQILHLLDQ